MEPETDYAAAHSMDTGWFAVDRDGHVAYFHRERRQAFVGDILFRGAIGAWEHADGDLPQLMRSIRHRLFPLGDDVRFVPGHGECSSFGRERRENPMVGDAAWAHWQNRHPA